MSGQHPASNTPKRFEAPSLSQLFPQDSPDNSDERKLAVEVKKLPKRMVVSSAESFRYDGSLEPATSVNSLKGVRTLDEEVQLMEEQTGVRFGEGTQEESSEAAVRPMSPTRKIIHKRSTRFWTIPRRRPPKPPNLSVEPGSAGDTKPSSPERPTRARGHVRQRSLDHPDIGELTGYSLAPPQLPLPPLLPHQLPKITEEDEGSVERRTPNGQVEGSDLTLTEPRVKLPPEPNKDDTRSAGVITELPDWIPIEVEDIIPALEPLNQTDTRSGSGTPQVEPSDDTEHAVLHLSSASVTRPRRSVNGKVTASTALNPVDVPAHSSGCIKEGGPGLLRFGRSDITRGQMSLWRRLRRWSQDFGRDVKTAITGGRNGDRFTHV